MGEGGAGTGVLVTLNQVRLAATSLNLQLVLNSVLGIFSCIITRDPPASHLEGGNAVTSLCG